MFRSNSAWFVLLPLIASIQLFPTGAITANGILPLGANLEKLLPFIASNSLPMLDSVSLPTDPFNWWLLLAALLSPAEPSLGFAALVFAALSMAFFGAWQLGKLFISKPWVITLVALGYSLSPQLLILKANMAVVELLAASTIPWALFFLIRALGAFNSARAWRWAGLLGLALALIAAASPIAFALLGVTVLIAAVSQPKRGLILLWSYLPALAVLYPLGRFALEAQNWSVLTQSSAIAFGPTEPLGLVNLVVLGVLVLLSLPTWFVSDAKTNFGFFGFAIAALCLSVIQPIASSAPLTIAAALALLILAGLAIESVRKQAISSLVGITVTAGVLYSGFTFGFVNQVNPEFKSSRVMPALVVAASDQDPNLRTLVLEVGEPLTATYVWGSGQKLEMSSALLESYPAKSDIQIALAEIAANLVAGNQDKLVPLLSETRVDFVLLATPNPEVEVGISSLDILQPAGATEYGVLWRVESENQSAPTIAKNDPIRPWQFGAVAAFALLALPTRASILGRRRKTGVTK